MKCGIRKFLFVFCAAILFASSGRSGKAASSEIQKLWPRRFRPAVICAMPASGRTAGIPSERTDKANEIRGNRECDMIYLLNLSAILLAAKESGLTLHS